MYNDESQSDEGWTLVPHGKRNGMNLNKRTWRNYKRDAEEKYQDEEISRSSRNENYKKILCKNINNVGKCIYNNKCLYAHSLEEQNVEPIRILAYDMIKKDENLSHIDLSRNKYLYNNLLSLAKECEICLDKKCTGGYNCKHGTCDKKYTICQIDLNKGTCDEKCGKIHLTKKGLIPYGVNMMKKAKTIPQIPKPMIINDEFFMFLGKNENERHRFNLMDHENIGDKKDDESECSEIYDNVFSHNFHQDDESECNFKFDYATNREEKTKKSIFRAMQN